MDGLVTSVVAVFATLAGSALTFVFQAHAARQAERFARDQQLRNERVVAYSAFAGALTDFRRAQNDRWHLEQDDAASPQFAAVRDDSYRLRATATGTLCQIRLLCGDDTLNALAQGALDAATQVLLAADEQDRAARGEKARLTLEQFLATAAIHVRP